MRAIPVALPLVFLSAAFVAAPTLGQIPVEPRDLPLEELGLSLVRDINRTSMQPLGAFPESFVALGSELFFVATDSNWGTELHRFPRGAVRAELFLDLRPGLASSRPSHLMTIGTRLFFACDDGLHGDELWVSDGTRGGTRLLVDLVPGSGSSAPRYLVALGSLTLFSASTAAEGRELWVTDGTTAGTQLLGDLYPGAQGSFPTAFRSALGAIWFSADDGAGYELWRTDGTSAGTRRVAEIYPGPEPRRSEDGPSEFTELNGRVLFRARDSALDEELWSSDGSAAGTHRVLDIVPGPQGSQPRELCRAGGAVFFRASTPTLGEELWRSDGTAAGTALVQDIEPGPTGSLPGELAEWNGRLYFAAATGATRDRELWSSDGGSSGTYRVHDIYPGEGSAHPSELVVVGGALYFAATDPAFGRELWTSDGTSAGTARVADIHPGTASSDPYQLTRIGTQGLAVGATEPEFGVQPWLSDGTASGTRSLGPILGPVSTASSNPTQLVDLLGSTFFVADDGIHGTELWISDGTAAGTKLVADLHPGPGDGLNATEALLRPVGDRLFFVATDLQRGAGLWVTQGTPASTRYLSPIERTPQRGDLVAAGDAVYYVASMANTGSELWRSDGTVRGTGLLLDIAPGPSSSSPYHLTAFGERLVFSASDAAGREPWITDGTAAGTRRLADIAPGAANSDARNFLPGERLLYFTGFDSPTRYSGLYVTDGSSASVQLLGRFDAGFPGFPLGPVTVGDRLFFAAHDGFSTARAWVSDGTPRGTYFLSENDFRYPDHFTPFGNGVLFGASVTGHGFELCSSDGTELGTRLVMDLDPTGSSYPGGPQGKFFPFGSRVLLYATTPATGQELFVTDGSAAGTTLVADLHPGPTGSYVNLLSMLGTRHAYFDVYDGGSLTQLWRTDGSGRGTQQLGDVRGGPPVLSGGKILLAATTALTGRELYRYDAGATAQPLGHGCGIAPPYPYLTANDPVLGATCTLRGERFPDDRTALVVVALPAAPLELSPGCNSYIDLGQTVATHTLRTAGSRWVLRFAVPADPALAGVVLAAQAWVGPAGTPLGVEFASAVQLTLGV